MDVAGRRRVARAVAPGGTDVIEVAVRDVVPPGPGEAVVRVEVAGLNHADTLFRSGTYVEAMPFPFEVGVEAAGVVMATGEDVDIPPGTRVAGTGWMGCCADFVTVRADRLIRMPSRLSFEAAASVAHAGAAAGALVRVWPVEGRRVAVWGAAGSVGRLLVALLAEHGAEVVAIGKGNRATTLRDLGAAHAIDRSAGGVADAVRAAVGGAGVGVVFDPVGSATFRTSLRMLAPRGCLINYGQLDGPVDETALAALYEAGGVFLTKFNSRAYVDGMADVAGLIGAAFGLAVRQPGVVAPVARRFELEQVAEGYEALESGVTGKVLLVPDGDRS